jgi:hypothetical protein
MKILIVAATEMEIEPIKNLVSVDLNKLHEITFLIAGVGMVNTTYHITKMLNKSTFDLALPL